MKVDVSLLVILGIFAVVGIKIGFTISQTQQESAPNDALDAVSFGPTSGDLLAHKLREAKTMFEEDLLSEHEFRLYRQQLLGLSGEMLERLAEEKDDDDEGPAETAEAAETDSGPDETTTDSLKPAENNDDRQSAPNVDVGELPPLPEVPSEMIRQRFDANERSGKLKELLADKLKAWKENVPSQKPAEGRVEGEREVAQRDNFVLNERPVEDEELLKAAKLAEALKPSLLPKKLFVGGEAGKYDFAGQSISQPDPNYPSIKGAAYSPDKHRWQGGSLLVSSCPDREATHKFIFTKTHKTGSSTITNLFHRFGYKYGLNMALPKDNMFYGWPTPGKASVTSIEQIGIYKPPFDIYASAHSVFSPNEQGAIVPGATYVTILRSPMSHFRSAFRYWQIGQSITQRSNIKGTGENGLILPEDFFASPQITARMHEAIGMPGLIYNSFAFDLGIQSENALQKLKNSPELLQKKIAELSQYFKFVVITDYMEESLLLLKRQFCWQLDDVVIGAMKVTPRKPGSKEPPMKTKAYYMKDPLWEKVVEYNWLDSALFDHFNNSLWDRIALERQKPASRGSLSWDEELLELKSRVATFSKLCAPLNYQHEDRHRSELEKDDLPDTERLCHLAYTDSKGYCKTFKREQGIAIDAIECYAQRRLTRWVLLRMGNGADEALFMSMVRSGSKFTRVRWQDQKKPYVYTPLAADSSAQAGKEVKDPWTGQKVVVARNPTTFGAGRAGLGGDSLTGVRGLRFAKETFDKLGGSASMFSFVAQHPVQDFADAWESLEMSDRLAVTGGKKETMAEFFANDRDVNSQRQRIWAALEVPLSSAASELVSRDGFCGFRLLNRMACRFGFDPNDEVTSRGPREFVSRYRQQRMNLFQVPLLAEYMEESLILIRQTICWKTHDFSATNVELWNSAKLSGELRDPSSGIRKAIESLIPIDMALYDDIEKTFWLKLAQRPGTVAELPIMKNAIEKMKEKCDRMFKGDLLQRAKNSRSLNVNDKACLQSVMDEYSFVPVSNADLSVSSSLGNDACLQAIDTLECERSNGIKK